VSNNERFTLLVAIKFEQLKTMSIKVVSISQPKSRINLADKNGNKYVTKCYAEKKTFESSKEEFANWFNRVRFCEFRSVLDRYYILSLKIF